MSDLDQFCILAKSQKGRACAALIQQAIGNKKIFVFGELLEIPSVSLLKDEEEFYKHFNTLELFAYGTYSDYINNIDNYIELNEFSIRKLKYLTIVTLAETNKNITYGQLSQILQVSDQRQLEDLIIETMYLNLIKGKLNQKQQILKIHDVFGRDVRLNSLPDIIRKLKLWKEHCVQARSILSDNINLIQKSREEDRQEQFSIEQTIQDIKKSVLEMTMRDDVY